MMALLTMPSASVALRSATPLTPNASDRLPGQVATIGGAVGAPHTLRALARLRGAGAPVLKSAPLLSVSVQPPAARRAAVVLLRVGATVPSK
jgi:hypothetical protein